MSKAFTHENDRAVRQSEAPGRTETDDDAPPGEAASAAAARAAWRTYVASLTAGSAPARPASETDSPPDAPAETAR
jgi:hypothetical protein